MKDAKSKVNGNGDAATAVVKKVTDNTAEKAEAAKNNGDAGKEVAKKAGQAGKEAGQKAKKTDK